MQNFKHIIFRVIFVDADLRNGDISGVAFSLQLICHKFSWLKCEQTYPYPKCFLLCFLIFIMILRPLQIQRNNLWGIARRRCMYRSNYVSSFIGSCWFCYVAPSSQLKKLSRLIDLTGKTCCHLETKELHKREGTVTLVFVVVLHNFISLESVLQSETFKKSVWTH